MHQTKINRQRNEFEGALLTLRVLLRVTMKMTMLTIRQCYTKIQHQVIQIKATPIRIHRRLNCLPRQSLPLTVMRLQPKRLQRPQKRHPRTDSVASCWRWQRRKFEQHAQNLVIGRKEEVGILLRHLIVEVEIDQVTDIRSDAALAQLVAKDTDMVVTVTADDVTAAADHHGDTVTGVAAGVTLGVIIVTAVTDVRRTGVVVAITL